jgi:tRNA A64-2'-O-ribosylphosphate transferase
MQGLTPGAFWKNHAELLSADRALLPSLVSRIVATSQALLLNPELSSVTPTSVNKVAGRLLLCTTSDLPVASVTETNKVPYIFLSSTQEKLAGDPNLYLPAVSGKRGASHFLQVVLPRSMEFIQQHLAAGENICVACESGKDLSVGVVLTALQLFFGDDGSLNFTAAASGKHVTGRGKSSSVIHLTDVYCGIAMDKASIRTRLEWIIASRPEANPSRATLKRVNEFLLTAPFRGAAPPFD